MCERSGNLRSTMVSRRAKIAEEDLRRYFLYLKNDKKAARSTCTVALCGIKFFYEHTLKREWPTLTMIRPPKEHKLPVVLSVEEVQQLLGVLAPTSLPGLLEHHLRLRVAGE